MSAMLKNKEMDVESEKKNGFSKFSSVIFKKFLLK